MSNITISSGQTSSGLTVQVGDTMTVVSGGTAINTGVFGTQNVAGGKAVGTELIGGFFSNGSAGGLQYVTSGGIASQTFVTSATNEVVSASGVTQGSVVENLGQETVSSGGTADATTVYSGGYLFVVSGGVASGATIASGGIEVLYPGSVNLAPTIEKGGIVEHVSSGDPLIEDDSLKSVPSGGVSVPLGIRTLFLNGSSADTDVFGALETSPNVPGSNAAPTFLTTARDVLGLSEVSAIVEGLFRGDLSGDLLSGVIPILGDAAEAPTRSSPTFAVNSLASLASSSGRDILIHDPNQGNGQT